MRKRNTNYFRPKGIEFELNEVDLLEIIRLTSGTHIEKGTNKEKVY